MTVNDSSRAEHEPTPPGAAWLQPQPPALGGSRELLALAFPLIINQSFATVQLFVDTLLLSWHDPREMAASFPAMMWFWVLFGFLSVTAGYTSTFVAQYVGAGRLSRVGPAVWQGVYFALAAGLLFLAVIPLAPTLIAWAGHPAEVQPLETRYLQCLSYAALPMLVMAAINGFFSGRGRTWTVLAIEGVGTGVNILLAAVLIFGEGGIARLGLPGFPGLAPMGIEGAGWAAVAGSWVSAVLAIALFLRKTHRLQFATLAGWRYDPDLFRRLMRYGGPAGLQVFLDALVFHLFTIFVGRLGEAQLGATTLTVRLNMIAFLPMMGMGQAISILVGQRLGANRPDLAERSARIGLAWTFAYMVVIAGIYVLFPHTLLALFASRSHPDSFAAMAQIVPTLLLCVAIYSLADSVNVSLAFALRGAGDTRFVTLVTFLLAWPLMVLPTAGVVTFQEAIARAWPGLGDPVYWSWAFATLHIVAMAACFEWRFRGGKWKRMRVIEPAETLPPSPPSQG